MKIKGKLVKIDMGTGGWALETKDGDKIALFGDVDASLADRQVEVDGQELEGASFTMVGNRMVQVTAVRAA